MASPQPDKFTRLSNEILENIGRYKFNGTQRGIIDQLWRYTYGFNRIEAELSLTFLAAALDIGKNQVDRELNALISRNVVHVMSGGIGKPRKLKFNKDFDTWHDKRPLKRGQSIDEQGVLFLDDGASSKKSTEPSSKKSTKKESNKDIFKERDTDMDKIQFLDTVFLTQEQYDNLCSEFGKETVDLYIEMVDEWQTNNPKKAKKDHNKTIRVWIKKDAVKKKPLYPSNQQQRNEQQMDALEQFYKEGAAREANGDSPAIGGHQNGVPELPGY